MLVCSMHDCIVMTYHWQLPVALSQRAAYCSMHLVSLDIARLMCTHSNLESIMEDPCPTHKTIGFECYFVLVRILHFLKSRLEICKARP